MSKQLRLKNLTKIGSNIYYAGVYDADYLPPAIRNDSNLVEEIDNSSIEISEFKNSLKTQKINIGSAQTNSEKTSFKTEPVVELPETNEESSKQEYNINQATVDELANLDGITVSTAQKIIEERNVKEFVDFADLDKRVSLKGNRKWENLSDRLSF